MLGFIDFDIGSESSVPVQTRNRSRNIKALIRGMVVIKLVERMEATMARGSNRTRQELHDTVHPCSNISDSLLLYMYTVQPRRVWAQHPLSSRHRFVRESGT